MFLYGGSTGSAMGDFHELKLEFRRVWAPVVVPSSSQRPGNKGGVNSNSGAAATMAMAAGGKLH